MPNSHIYQLVYEILTEAMVVVNRKGVIIEANPSAATFFKYPHEVLVGMNVDELLPDGLREIHKRHRKGYMQNPGKRSMGVGLDLEAQDANGKLIPVEISLNHAQLNGEMTVVALISDITKRKEADDRMLQINRELEEGVAQRTKELDTAVKALEESQHLYTLIAQNFPDGTINVLSSNFSYVFSEGQEFSKRVDEESLIGENYVSLIPKKYQEHVTAELNKVKEGFPRSFEIVTGQRTYIMSAVPLYDNQEINRILLVEKNISEQKQAEHDMVAALNKERELNELKSRFVSMASHEFRTPLATILSSVNLVNRYAENENTDGIAKHVGRIRNSVRNLTSILNDFLSLEKLEQGKVAFSPEEFSMCQLSRSVAEEMSEMTKNGQSIDLQCCPGKKACTEGLINGLDPQLIRNILFNLLSNAIKYSNDNSTIVVRIEIESTLTISVEDQGIGIPEKEQQHLFERFFRAKNATNIQGTGLGLNIVQKHVELMGGTIDFESVVDQGTTFIISLPIQQTNRV